MEVCVNTGRRGGVPRVEGNLAIAASAERVRSGAYYWAEALGILGCKAAQKSVPADVFMLCDEDLELFLGRLWSGDGFICGVGNQVPFYATSSRQLAADVSVLLLRLGILNGIHEKEFKYGGSTRRGYTVHLFGDGSIETFLKRVGPTVLVVNPR